MKKERVIIGICGKKRHGKTALSLILSTLFNLNNREVIVLNFADYLKKIADELYNIKISRYHKNLNFKERKILLDLGDKLREIDEHSLTNYIERKIKKSKRNVIVGDVRLEIEANMIKESGGKVIRVINKNVTNPEKQANDHKTETEIDLIKEDFIIYNDGNPVTLLNSVDQLLKEHFNF